MTTRSFPKVVGPTGGKPRLLIVEDDQSTGLLYARNLRGDYEITTANDGIVATTLLQEHPFDVVLADYRLPGISGVELLRLIRTYDLEIPVLLMSEAPDVEGAMLAVELGAIGYVLKSHDYTDVKRRLAKGLAMSRLATAKREARDTLRSLSTPPAMPVAADHAVLTKRLEDALRLTHLVYQPIISASAKEIIAYEALMRPREPSMSSPAALLAAAEQLDMLNVVTERITELAAGAIPLLPKGKALFVNIHANDLLTDFLYEGCPLATHADRVVLEITERGSIEGIPGLAERSRRLRAVGYGLAIDDLGAGYAGLTTFAHIEPEIVKIDMSLIRGIDTSVVRQRIVASLVTLCRELSMAVVAEGIETSSELSVVIDLGCDLLQGYFLARPSETFTATFNHW